MNPDDLASNLVFVIPNATLYHFGILTSFIHMTWLRTVGGRFESRYRYSKDVVYNNFVWSEPSEKNRKKFKHSAQTILDVRNHYPDATFAELYDEVSMPYDLRDAHRNNVLAVAVAYNFENFLDDESAVVSALLYLYKIFSS